MSYVHYSLPKRYVLTGEQTVKFDLIATNLRNNKFFELNVSIKIIGYSNGQLYPI